MPTNLLDRSRYWNCTNAEYHGDLTHDSHSSLDLFMHSIEQYAARRVFRTVPNPPPTIPMVIGSLFHTTVLEPEQLAAEYAEREKNDRRTKAGKIAAADFEERASGKTIVEPEQIELAWAMRDGIFRNNYAAELLRAPGLSEVSMQCVNQDTGLPLKIRVDRLTQTGV